MPGPTASRRPTRRRRTVPAVRGAVQRRLHRWGVAPVRHSGSPWPLDLYRFELPPSLTWSGRAGRLEIPLDAVTTAAGFSLGKTGWHPHVETLRTLLGHGDVPPEQTPLARLYDAFQPRTVGEAILDDHDGYVPGLTNLPLVRGQLRELWNPHGGRRADGGKLDRPGLYWGPASTAYVRSEIDRTRRVHESLSASGFVDDGPGKEAVSGYFLVRGDDFRFVVHQGHHRLATLTVLGQSTVPVYFAAKTPPVVREDRLERWTEGRQPRYTPEAAHLLFTRLFESTGREKAARYGLVDESPECKAGPDPAREQP